MKWTDLAILAIYLGAMLLIGFVSMKKVKSEEDFVLAGRSLNPIWMLLSIFASWTGLSGLLGTPQYVYTYGIAGGWWWFTFPIGVFLMGITLAKILRSRMHVTLPDIVDYDHSSKGIRVAASIVTSWNYLAWTAAQVSGIILIITTFTDLDSTASVVIAYLVIIAFTLLGGFRAVVHTDVLQAIVFLLIIGVVTPLIAVANYDCVGAFRDAAAIPGFYSLFSSVPFGTMVTWWLLLPAGFIDTMAFQRVFASKDDRSARRGITSAFILMTVFGFILMFLGVVAKAILPSDIDPANTALMLFAEILPTGFIGLLVAALLGVAMSTASTTLIVCAATIERDIFSVFVPNTSGKTKLQMSRLFVLLFGLLALIVALKIPSVTTLLMYGYSVYVPGLLLPVIAGTLRWKINNRYMLASILTGAVSAVLLIMAGEPVPASLGGLIISAIPFTVGILQGKKQQSKHEESRG